MDLLVRVIVIAVILIAILFVAYYAFIGHVAQTYTQQQAETLVKADLQRSYPTAIVNVTSITPSTYSGSWHIVTDVILNSTSPCPSFFVYTYDYPQFGFQSTLQNTYTDNCVIYGQGANNNTIGNFAVAITKAYDLNVSSVRSYVSYLGFASVTASAQSFTTYSVLGKNFTNVWVIEFSSSASKENVYVLLSRLNSSLLATYNITAS